MKKSTSQLERGIGAAAVIVIIVIIVVVGVSGYYFMAGGEGVAPPREIYTFIETASGGAPSMIENQKFVSAWENAKELEEAKFVATKDSYSVLVFMHPYQVGAFNPSKAEWIIIAYSTLDTSNEIRVAIVRLDYTTFHLKKAYQFSYPKNPELTLDEAVAIAEERASEEEAKIGLGPVEVEGGELGGNYICHYSLGDFMGTIIVNKYVGEPIFYATTIWQGTGRLIIPEP